jgi:hypothetical protein
MGRWDGTGDGHDHSVAGCHDMWTNVITPKVREKHETWKVMHDELMINIHCTEKLGKSVPMAACNGIGSR